MNFLAARRILPVAQRAKGELALGFKRVGDATRIDRLFQSGCLKARLPRPVGAFCDAVTLNIGGGVAGGDVLSTAIDVLPGAHVSIASQAAERIYRALAEPAEMFTRIEVGQGAVLEYLPQETILFHGFALRRSLEVSLAGDASYLGVESLVFGRLAMGEAVRAGSLRDRITMRRDGRLILQDMTRLEGDISTQLGRKAIAEGATACSSIVFAAPSAGLRLDALRAALGGAHAGASCVEGVIFARVLAPHGAALRRLVVSALYALRDGRPLPRVWQG
jgi:urease accessory protein